MTKTRRPTPKSPTIPTRGLAAATGLVVPPGLWLVAPVAALIVLVAEIVLAAIVVLSALFGSDRISRRAFQVLGRKCRP
jgi:hypothetical protein